MKIITNIDSCRKCPFVKIEVEINMPFWEENWKCDKSTDYDLSDSDGYIIKDIRALGIEDRESIPIPDWCPFEGFQPQISQIEDLL